MQLLTAAEEQWLQQSIAVLRRYAGASSEHRFNPAELDTVFDRWLPTAMPGDSADQMINAIGAAFGQCFVDECNWLWVRVEDAVGPDLAVQPAWGAPMFRPLAFVGKRFDRREPGFFAETCSDLVHQAAQTHHERRRKSWWRLW